MKWLLLVVCLVPVTVMSPGEKDFNTIPKKNTHTIMDRVCLAEAIWRESRGETLQGQIAVAKVVLNRVAHDDYPDTVCRVVFQPYQFTWSKTWKGWRYDRHSLTVASTVLAGNHNLKNFKATHFHSGPQPDWAKKLTPYKKIGNHVFYK